ncbi:MAG: hypothetical protein ABFE07_28025 [Armatimonadia bacterium]
MSDNCHSLEKFARESARQWIREAQRTGRPFEEYVAALKRPRDRRLLAALATGSRRFKDGDGDKLSAFQRQFLQVAANQKLSPRKSSSVWN